jgi:hypothetical protein
VRHVLETTCIEQVLGKWIDLHQQVRKAIDSMKRRLPALCRLLQTKQTLCDHAHDELHPKLSFADVRNTESTPQVRDTILS